MKKIKYLSSLLLILVMSCDSSEEIQYFKKLSVSIVYAYSMSNTVGEANVATSDFSNQFDEIGVVWSTKSNPTTADNRESVSGINNVQT
jgi:hypothetical protein